MVSAGILLTVDSRKRITLGALATHERYVAIPGPGGSITLYPTTKEETNR